MTPSPSRPCPYAATPLRSHRSRLTYLATAPLCRCGRTHQSPTWFFTVKCRLLSNVLLSKNLQGSSNSPIPKSIVCGPSSHLVHCTRPFCPPDDPYMSDMTTFVGGLINDIYDRFTPGILTTTRLYVGIYSPLHVYCGI